MKKIPGWHADLSGSLQSTMLLTRAVIEVVPGREFYRDGALPTETANAIQLFGSVRFGSVRFGSVRFCSVLFCSVLFCSVFDVQKSRMSSHWQTPRASVIGLAWRKTTFFPAVSFLPLCFSGFSSSAVAGGVHVFFQRRRLKQKLCILRWAAPGEDSSGCISVTGPSSRRGRQQLAGHSPHLVLVCEASFSHMPLSVFQKRKETRVTIVTLGFVSLPFLSLSLGKDFGLKIRLCMHRICNEGIWILLGVRLDILFFFLNPFEAGFFSVSLAVLELWKPDWPWTLERSTCVCLLSAGIKGVHYCAWLKLDNLETFMDQNNLYKSAKSERAVFLCIQWKARLGLVRWLSG